MLLVTLNILGVHDDVRSEVVDLTDFRQAAPSVAGTIINFHNPKSPPCRVRETPEEVRSLINAEEGRQRLLRLAEIKQVMQDILGSELDKRDQRLVKAFKDAGVLPQAFQLAPHEGTPVQPSEFVGPPAPFVHGSSLDAALH